MVSSFDDVYQQALDDAADQVRAPQGVRRMGVNFSRDASIMGGIAAPSEGDQEMRASLTRFTSRPNSLRGLFHQLTGNVDAAQEQYRRVDEINARADALDSNVDTDLRNAGSVGDVAAGVRKLLIQSGPDMALGGLAGGLGRAGARRAAISHEVKALARNPSQELAQAAAKARPGAAAASPQVAALQRAEALQKAARSAVKNDAAAMVRVDRAGRVGGFTAGTAGMVPGLLAEQNEFLQEHTGQADAAKVLAAATGAAALEYLPLDRLMGRAFKNPALKQAFLESNPSLGRQLARRAGTAAKNTAGQAGMEGLTEAGQALIQRTGQKWVDNNVELFSKEALDDYMVNFIGGAAVGGVMGGAVDGSQAVAGSTADTARWAWDRSGGLRESIRENLSKPWFRGQGGTSRAAPGTPMGPSDPGGAGGTAADLMARAQASLRTGYQAVQEAAGKARSAAAEGFQKAANALNREADLDAQADAVMGGLDAAVSAEADAQPVGLRPGMVKGELLRNWALSKVQPEYLGQLGDSAAGHLGNALNHLARGALLSAPQKSIVERAMAAGALSNADFDTVRAVGPSVLKRMNALSRSAGDELGTYRSPQHGDAAADTRGLLDEDAIMDGADAPDPASTFNAPQVDREVPALDRANSARQGMRAATARGDVEGRNENRAAGRAAFAQARTELLKGLTTDENRSSPKAAQHYDARKAQPGFVELRDKVDRGNVPGKVMRGQLVNLAMLIKRQQVAMNAEGVSTDNIAPRDALLRGLSELAQAGAAINPDTLTPGAIVATYTDKDGNKTKDDEHVYTLTADDIKAIKAARFVGPARHPDMVRKVKGELQQANVPIRETDKGWQKSDAAKANEPRLDQDFANQTRHLDEDTPGTPEDESPHILRAREAPPGVQREDGFVTDSSPVSSVSFDNRYADALSKWRKERSAAESPAQRSAISRRYGELIGAEALAREHENGTISDKRLENALARLRDPNSNLHKKYLERALKGELDGGETTASVRHAPSDNAKYAKGKDADSWTTRVDEESGDYQGSDKDLRKQADSLRKTAEELGQKKDKPEADWHKDRLTLNERGSHKEKWDKAEKKARLLDKSGQPVAKPKAKKRVVKKAEAVEAERDATTTEVFEARVDALFDGAAPAARGVRILDEGDLLTLLGFGKGEVTLAEGHVMDGVHNHGLTKEDVKNIPKWLDDPIAVFERPENKGNLTFVALNERTNKAMIIAVEPGAYNANGTVKYRHITLTAYDKDHGSPFARWAREGSMLYRDKKATPAFNRVSGHRLPGHDEGLRGPNGKILSEKDLFKFRSERQEQRDGAVEPDTGAAVDAAAQTQPGQHDLKAESSLANAIMAALGYVGEQFGLLRVTNQTRPGNAGEFAYRTVRIGMTDALTGRERIEVLSHEIGHAVIAAEISKVTGVPVKDLVGQDGQIQGEQWMLALKDANPKLYADLKRDYDMYRARHGLDSSYTGMRMGRTPAARAAAVRRQARAKGTAQHAVGDTRGPTYSLSMNEWLADNIARALVQNKHGQSIVEKFFGRIAAQLKRAYDLLFKGKQAKRWAPAPSVEAWIGSLFDANVAAVKATTKKTVVKKTADAAVTAAVHTATSPRPEPQAGGANPPPPPRGPSNTQDRHVPPEEFEGLMDYVREFLPPAVRQTLHQAFSTTAANKAIRTLFEAVPGHAALLDDAQVGMEARIAAGYIAWRHGLFNGGSNSTAALYEVQDKLLNLFNVAGTADYAQRILGDMARGTIAKRVAERGKDGYNYRKNEERARGSLQKAVNGLVSVRDAIMEPVNRAFQASHDRMRESGVPALRAIASSLYKSQGDTGGDRGLLRDAVHVTARFADRAGQVFQGMTPIQMRRVMDALQRGITDQELADRRSPVDASKPFYSERTRSAVREVRAIMDESLEYMRQAGVKVGKIENFFPVLLDIRDDAAALKLEKLLRRTNEDGKPKFEQAIRNLDVFAQRDEDGNKTPSKAPFDDLIKNLVAGARSEPGVAKTGSGAPNFAGANQRLMRFIYTHGSPVDIKAFANLQTKNPAEAFARYFEPMVKRAEYARRFGDDGSKLQAMLDRAKEQGATDEQLAHAKGSVEAALGVYGQELSPVLNAISPALAKKLSGRKTRATIDGLQAYQNARLLPLSLLSSLVDPAGVAVRSGGDLGIAWRGFRDGLRTLYKQSSKDQMQDMLRMLGSTSDMSTHEALNQMFGGAGTRFAGRVNDFVFKWNGMSAWVRATRYMALNGAHEFLLKHADGKATEHSARYLSELGLKDGDIEGEVARTTDGRERVLVKLDTGDNARDARVRQALMDFVDGAILRPNSQQTPLWHSDPYMGLVTQYKSFAYAFYDQIAGRVGTEMRNGNAKVLAAAAAYFPVIIMAEMLRNVLQGDSDDTEDWGPDDWAMLGLERSGFVNPTLMAAKDSVEDVQRNRLPGTSQMGATPSQARNVFKAFDGQRDLGKEFESALPGSALYRKWNDEPRAAAGEA